MRALPLPLGEVPSAAALGGEGFLALSVSFADSSPRVGAKGPWETDCHASVSTGSQ